ncbi:hypothetical protein TEA_007675 [Camellia sinensis var. sinensis]|uniref:Helicase ATP-binding domain-containing protein n=1 Tax=Camellia sinensis var. sinensis TaxID=542762 RepID=A0A4S4DCH8_CAMSN|nr:hypothetical protein TEA_007675 [Camellia sinensis var. sinensis]
MDSSFLGDPHPISPHRRPASHAIASSTATASATAGSSQEKKALREEKLKQEETYMWVSLDGVKEKSLIKSQTASWKLLSRTAWVVLRPWGAPKAMEAEIVAKPQVVNPCCVVLKEKYSKLEASRNALRQGFTRMVLSLWAMTMLSLYIRVQVNILGRHLYIDTARDLGSSHLLFGLSNAALPFSIEVAQRKELCHCNCREAVDTVVEESRSDVEVSRPIAIGGKGAMIEECAPCPKSNDYSLRCVEHTSATGLFKSLSGSIDAFGPGINLEILARLVYEGASWIKGKTIKYCAIAHLHAKKKKKKKMFLEAALVALSLIIVIQGGHDNVHIGEACSSNHGPELKTFERSWLRNLERGVDILVATPGRLVDMIERARVSLRMIKYLALDEADRMLDMGFEPQIRRFVEQMEMPPPGARQTMLFSATFPTEIQRLASDIMSNYIFLAVGRVGSSTDLIVQKVEFVQDMDKRNYLMDLLHTQCDNGAHGKCALTLVFVETKRGADALERWLSMNGFPATAIHGDKVQMGRAVVWQRFKGCTPYAPLLLAIGLHKLILDEESVGHFLIHYEVARVLLWALLLIMIGMEWVFPQRARSLQSNKLGLHFCPEDPYSHPAFGELQPLKNDQHVDECQIDSITAPTEVKAQLPEEVQEDLSADIVARVSEAYYFNGMVDYQHIVAVHAGGCCQRKKRNWADMEPQFEKCGLMDVDQKDLMILVPPLFSIKDVPEKVVSKEKIRIPRVKAITAGPLTNGQNSASASLIDDDKDGKTAPRCAFLFVLFCEYRINLMALL